SENWVEILNMGTQGQDLSGWTIKDGKGGSYVVPGGITLPPGTYIAFDVGFLDKNGDVVHVLDNTNKEIDWTSWVAGQADAPTSWGRFPDATGAFATLTPTKGAKNKPLVGTIVVNEISAGNGADWIELFNVSTKAPIVISGYTITNGNAANAFAVPNGTVVAAGDYVVFDQAAFVFDLAVTGDSVHLKDLSMTDVDSTSWISGQADAGTTWGRLPNGSGTFTTTAPTKGAKNLALVPIVVINEVSAEQDWVEL